MVGLWEEHRESDLLKIGGGVMGSTGVMSCLVNQLRLRHGKNNSAHLTVQTSCSGGRLDNCFGTTRPERRSDRQRRGQRTNRTSDRKLERSTQIGWRNNQRRQKDDVLFDRHGHVRNIQRRVCRGFRHIASGAQHDWCCLVAGQWCS